jgi:hypothetical protein
MDSQNWSMLASSEANHAVIPAQAGIQKQRWCHIPWIPAYAGMTRKSIKSEFRLKLN